MLRPMLPGSDTYGLSETLWGKVPLEYIFGYHDRNYGVGLIDNFTGFGRVGPNLASSLAYYSGNGIVYRSFELVGGTSAAGISAKAAAAALPGGIVLTTGTSADDQVSIQAGAITASANIVPFALIPNTSGELYFEAYFMVSSITTAIYDCFVGLAGSGCGVTALPLTASDILGSTSAIGFGHLQADTTDLGLMYNRASGTPSRMASVATLAANTFIKAGFKWSRSKNSVTPYINGVAMDGIAGTSKIISPTVTGATPWPNDYMTLCASILNYTTTAVNMTLQWWAVAQLAP